MVVENKEEDSGGEARLHLSRTAGQLVRGADEKLYACEEIQRG